MIFICLTIIHVYCVVKIKSHGVEALLEGAAYKKIYDNDKQEAQWAYIAHLVFRTLLLTEQQYDGKYMIDSRI